METPVHCDTCEGSGARPGDLAAVRCPECQGAGELRRVRQSILGQVITAVPCGRCQGTGPVHRRPLSPTAGARGRRNERRTLTVDIPAGVDEGSTPAPGRPRPGRIPGRSERCPLRPRVGGSRTASSNGRASDLHASVHVPLTLAALGGSVGFDTLDDARDLSIAAGTHTGAVLPLKGLGVPRLRWPWPRRPLRPRDHVDTPTDLDDRQKELLVALAAARGEDLGDPPLQRGDLLEAALRPQLRMAAAPGRPAAALRTRCWRRRRPWSSSRIRRRPFAHAG